MKKFAYAALTAICVGAAGLLLTTPLDAKGGGSGGHSGFHGRLNIGPLATRGHPIARNIGPLAGRHFHASRHHHGHRGRGHGGDLLFPGDYGYSDYGYSDYAVPDEDVSDLYAPLPPAPLIAHPVIRTVAESQQVCSSQFVTVPASGGGDTTIRIMRC